MAEDRCVEYAHEKNINTSFLKSRNICLLHLVRLLYILMQK